MKTARKLAMLAITLAMSLVLASCSYVGQTQESSMSEHDYQPNAIKQELNTTIDLASSVDSARYTDESVQDLVSALADAMSVKGNNEATQDEVDTATDRLKNSISGLVEDPDKIAAIEAEEQAKAAEQERIRQEQEAQQKLQQEINNATVSQKNALNQAKNYLSVMHFSHSGLVSQLEFEQYPHDDAVWAVDRCGADWNEQAAGKAQDYLDTMSFSRQGLIDQLLFEGFTQEQAEYGVNAVGL